MLSDTAHEELNGRLVSLWKILESGASHRKLAAEVNRLLDDYTAATMHDDDKLLPAGWRESYRGGDPIVCGLFGNIYRNPDDEKLYSLFMAMVAFEADDYQMPDTDQALKTRLSRWLHVLNGRDYRVVGGDERDGPPIELLVELSPQSRELLTFLWSNRQTTRDAVYALLYGVEARLPNSVTTAIKRLNDKLNELTATAVSASGFKRIEVISSKGDVMLNIEPNVTEK